MSVFTIQAAFGRGELSPRLHSRADIEYFKSGLKICSNWMVMRQGGLKRRPGTQFIGEIKDSTKTARVMPFIFSAQQAYVLEVGDGYFRVYANGGRVGTVEVTSPWAMADLFSLDYDQTNDKLDVAHRLYQPQRIARNSHTSWSVGPVATIDGPYLTVNTTATTITPSDAGNAIPIMTSNTAPSGTASASSIRDAARDAFKAMDGVASDRWQSGNDDIGGAWLAYAFAASKVITGYVVQSTSHYSDAVENGPNLAPKAWTFEGYNGSVWVILDTQFGQSNWGGGELRFYSFNNTTSYSAYRLVFAQNNGAGAICLGAFSMQESPATSAAITLTASSTVGINGGAGFSASDVGRYLTLLGSDAAYHAFQISGYTSPTVVAAKLTGAPLPSIRSGPQWKLGAWGTAPGWPAHVCAFEGRKVYARTDGQPNRVDLTRTGGYGPALDFSVRVPTVADDAISFILTDVNEIAWISEGYDMMIGTAGAARTLGRDSANLGFSATNFRQALASAIGSAAIRPAKAANSTLFAPFYAKAIREFVRSDNGIDYITPDLSVLSEHLFAKGVIEMSFQQEPDTCFWWPRNDGEVVGLTFEKDQSMAGMHHHQLGGGGIVESACVIPGATRHEVWMIVRRVVNGTTKRYIERMAAPYNEEIDSPADQWFLDCALQYSGAPANVIAGLGHLEGQTVSILADGAREPDQVVTGGQVTLASGRTASKVLVGLSYQSRARTLPSNIAIGDGSGLGRKKKIVKAMVDVLATGSLKVGRTATAAEEILSRRTTDILGAAVPLQTGFHDARYDSRWEDGGEIEMIADGPFAATIRSLTLNLEPVP